MEDDEVKNIPEYMDVLRREQKMQYGSVKNVQPKPKKDLVLGGDMYPTPRRELSYPLKPKQYPQYSPSGKAIMEIKDNLKNVHMMRNQARKDDEVHFDLGEYEKTVQRRLQEEQKKRSVNRKFLDIS